MRNTVSLFLCTLALVLFSVPATAQLVEEGFGLNRFEPAEQGSDWFANESLDLRGDMRWAAGLTLEWASAPLDVFDPTNDEFVATPVADQVYAHLGGSLVLIDRVRIGVNIPLLITQGAGDSALYAPTGELLAGSNSGALGDIRLGADVRLLGNYGDDVTVAAGLQLHLPTGSRTDFSGDGAIRVTPRVLVAGDIGIFSYAGRLSIAIRAQDDELLYVPLGSELSMSAAAGVRLLDRKLLVGPELIAATGFGDFFGAETTPVEVLFGGHYREDDFRFGFGFGPGLAPGWGSPDVRVLGSFAWHPELGGDRDGDGVRDADDACIDIPGMASDDDAINGCPDADGDGIVDGEDACPQLAGLANDDPEKHGCPNDDTDADSIVNAEDACPNDAGPANDDPEKHGCPVARVEGGQIRIIERVEFETASSEIRDSSGPVLLAVLDVLSEYPDITLVRVEGHTDNRGKPAYNRRLSRERAGAVKRWLVGHGIDKGRLAVEGVGPDRPIESNETDEGRQKNRRVEFHILERVEPDPEAATDGGGTDADDAAPDEDAEADAEDAEDAE